MSFSIEQAKKFISEQFDSSIIPTLSKYIEIPNQSPAYDKEWATNGYMNKAIDIMINWVKNQNIPGLKVDLIQIPEKTPVIFLTLEGKDSDQTVLLYGHLDKQPPLTEAWSSGLHPNKPIIKDGKIYNFLIEIKLYLKKIIISYTEEEEQMMVMQFLQL
jgi:acetylornithine deacetylase/succinyl-diaminopimelate desuccinylase-like protein